MDFGRHIPHWFRPPDFQLGVFRSCRSRIMVSVYLLSDVQPARWTPGWVSIAGLVHFRPLIWEKLSSYGNLFIFLSLLVLTGAWFLCYDQHSYTASILGFPLVSLGYGLIVIGAICPNSILYQWESKSTTLIATLSYAIYLTHKGIIHVIQQAFKSFKLDTNTNLMLVICLVACLTGALALNRIVEKPFMKWRDYIIVGLRNKVNELEKIRVS